MVMLILGILGYMYTHINLSIYIYILKMVTYRITRSTSATPTRYLFLQGFFRVHVGFL